ncbi:hypothetical protein B6Q00_27230, partial [Escherichia coli]|nr:hypothetical protein [Escherichia coli]
MLFTSFSGSLVSRIPGAVQAEALRQKDQQLSLVEETEAFLRSALTRAEEKIEEDEREIEHLRAQIEKLRRMLFGTR